MALAFGLLILATTGCDLVLGIQDLPRKLDGSTDVSTDAPLLQTANKLDLLLMVDNSSSMGEKQDLLASALPELIAGLSFIVGDMHIGVVTSSLGGGGAVDICDPKANISAQEAPTLTAFNRHNDDKAHLINRTKLDPLNPAENTVTDAKNYLAWSAPADYVALGGDFAQLAVGAGVYGCGLEAQMESWYRFLVQPDPWDSITLDGQVPAAASLNGVDATILTQRKDFLRPDSLVAIVVLTDEEDSWSDPMWFKGHGWITRTQSSPYSTTGQLPPGTSICSTAPADPACTWCGFKGTENDPACIAKKVYGPKEDGLNVRYTDDMKRRYGMNAQFPITRYVDALQSATVPDRSGEHYDTNDVLMTEYQGRKTCRNPLFSQSLPSNPNGELCNLAPGPRGPNLVFFGLLGGVPSQLLPNRPLTASDWKAIIGNDPGAYDLSGIDPHMVESIVPRAGITCGPMSADTCDPFHGREWDTTTSKVGIDLQYACTFPLPNPIDCTKLPGGGQCDCGGSYAGPLCDKNPNDGNNKTLQTRGKAYPAIRELRVAHALGDNAVIGSICPTSINAQATDYGYRPFVRSLVARLTPLLKR